MPNNFSSIAGVNFEISTALNQSMTFFYKVLNKFMFTAIEAFVICFDSVSKNVLFCY